MTAKNLLIVVFTLFFSFSCKQEQADTGTPTAIEDPDIYGKALFEGEGNCRACHQVDQKIIGPSIKEIARVYKQKKGNLVLFLKGEAPPIVDPAQYESMKLNLEITKAMSSQQLEAIQAYILSIE